MFYSDPTHLSSYRKKPSQCNNDWMIIASDGRMVTTDTLNVTNPQLDPAQQKELNDLIGESGKYGGVYLDVRYEDNVYVIYEYDKSHPLYRPYINVRMNGCLLCIHKYPVLVCHKSVGYVQVFSHNAFILSANPITSELLFADPGGVARPIPDIKVTPLEYDDGVQSVKDAIRMKFVLSGMLTHARDEKTELIKHTWPIRKFIVHTYIPPPVEKSPCIPSVNTIPYFAQPPPPYFAQPPPYFAQLPPPPYFAQLPPPPYFTR